MKEKVRYDLSLLWEIGIAVAVPVAWCMMVYRPDENGLFSSVGLNSLKYFTVQSNFLAGIGSLLCVMEMLIHRNENGKLRSGWITLRLLGSASLFLTFLTVVAFLRPLYGYASMYKGANLWFHLIIPIASILGVPLLRGESISKKQTLFAFVPISCYAVFYVSNIWINGIGVRPHSNDWYGLLNWGYGVGIVLLFILCAVIVGAFAALRWLYHRCNRRSETEV